MPRVPMNTAGAEALRKEIAPLTTVDRPRIPPPLAETHEHRRLKETDEYQPRREQPGTQ